MRLNASCKMGCQQNAPHWQSLKSECQCMKRHLTLQSIFNRGECMMHGDKNADDHVMDQNVDQLSREIAYVPLGGGIRSKRSSCMQFFFFFLSEYKICLPGGRRILAHVFRGLGFWGFGSCFQRTKGSGSWLMFSEA